MSIVRLLKRIKLERGISKKKIDDFEGEVGISYLLNIELPLVFTPNDDSFKSLVSRIDSIRKIRNKVVHENRPVTYKEANEALQTTVEFINFMKLLNN